MKNIKLLWLLQEIEKKEKEMLQSCRDNMALKDLRTNKEQILARQSDYSEVKKKYQTLNEAIKQKEEEIRQLMDKQTEILKKLYDGSVSQSKELQKMQQQSQQLKDKALELEEVQLQEMEDKERLVVYLKSEQETLKNNVDSYKTQKMQYDIEKLNVEQELAQLGDEKEKLLSEIPPELLIHFRKSQKPFNGLPITLIGANRLCSICGVEVTRMVVEKAKTSPGKVSCESCGRIIYVE